MKHLFLFTCLAITWIGMALFVVEANNMKIARLEHIVESSRAAPTKSPIRNQFYQEPVELAHYGDPEEPNLPGQLVRVEGRIIDIRLDARNRPTPTPPPLLLPGTMSLTGYRVEPSPPVYEWTPPPTPIGLHLVVDQIVDAKETVVPEVLWVELIGLETVPARVTHEWVDNQLRAKLADQAFRVVCDLALPRKGLMEYTAPAQCWLNAKTVSLEETPPWVETTPMPIPEATQDIGQLLLAYGMIARAAIKDRYDAAKRALFVGAQGNSQLDLAYRRVEQSARQARIGVWKGYRTSLKTH